MTTPRSIMLASGMTVRELPPSDEGSPVLQCSQDGLNCLVQFLHAQGDWNNITNRQQDLWTIQGPTPGTQYASTLEAAIRISNDRIRAQIMKLDHQRDQEDQQRHCMLAAQQKARAQLDSFFG